MKNLNLPTISMEAIQYQGRSLLLFDIVSVIETMRNNITLTQADLDRSKLTDVIFHRTGMRVQAYLADEFDLHACYIEPPLVDAANPYFKLLQNGGMYEAKKNVLEKHQRAVRLAQDSLSWVDLKTGRVHGMFSTLVNRLFISAAIITDKNFTSDEIAAILIHELGHLFSYFETMAYSTANNMVIATAVQALHGMEDQSAKLQLISQSLSVFGPVDAEAVEVISSEGNEGVQRALLLKTIEQAEQDRVRTMAVEPTKKYNARSIEFMADQFAVRHGAVLPLATARHKLAKMDIPDYGRGKVAFYAVQAARMGLLALTFMIPGMPVVGYLIASSVTIALSYEAITDDGNSDPAESIGQMKADLVQLLKNTKLDPKYRKQILQDIEAIDALRAEIKQNAGIFRFIWRNVVPMGRRQAKLREFQKGLEELTNNDLFLHASRLRGV